PAGITPTGLARLRARMLAAGHVSRLRLNALKGERAPVLAGGLAIMSVAVAVERFTERYGIDRAQAARVAKLAVSLFRRTSSARDSRAEQLVEWAARLHELGMSVSHTGF